MSELVVHPRMKGFIVLNAHPAGCAANVDAAIEVVGRTPPPRTEGALGGAVLVIGASTGYGLASSLVSAFRYGAPVFNVCLEREPTEDKPGSAGWYNLARAQEVAAERGLTMGTSNADCFAAATKAEVVRALKERYGPISTLVYSVAAPVRTDPDTGERHRSVLKPLGEPFATKTVKLDSGEISPVTLEPATDEEVESTRKVMGGEDWALWVEALRDADLLADGFRTVAYNYLGPSITHPVYRWGTIGTAKDHLEATARELDGQLRGGRGGGAWTVVNGVAVTQAAAAIPTVPLYISTLFRVLDEQDRPFRSTVEQMIELFDEHLRRDHEPTLDEAGRVRVDQWELDDAVQREVADRWTRIDDTNAAELTDFPRFRRAFRSLFGFELDDVDYDQPVEVVRPLAGG